MATLHDAGARLNDVAAIVETIADEAEKKALRRPLGEIFGLMYCDLELPIIRQYRDLDPDKNEQWYLEAKARNPRPTEPSDGDA